MPDTISSASESLAQVLRILGRLSGDVHAVKQLLQLLGWDLPPSDDISLTHLDVSTLVKKIDELTELRSDPAASDEKLAITAAEMALALNSTLANLDHLIAGLQTTPDYLAKTQIKDQFFRRFWDLAIIHLAAGVAPGAVSLGVLLGVFEFKYMPADPAIFQVEHIRQVVHWDRLGTLFTDPADLMRDVYGWGTPDFKGNLLVGNIARLMEHFADAVTMRALPRAVEEQLAGHPVPEADTAPASQLFVSIAKGLGLRGEDVGLSLFPLRGTKAGASDAGLGIMPYMLGTTETKFQLSDTLTLQVTTTTDFEGGLGIVSRPRQELEILSNIFSTGVKTKATFILELRYQALPDESVTLIEAAETFKINAKALLLRLGLRTDATNKAELFSEIGLEGGKILISTSSSDSFLKSILPSDGLQTDIDFSIGWSKLRGVYISGASGNASTGFEKNVPINKTVGPLNLQSLYSMVKANDEGISIIFGLGVGFRFGPITITVDKIGIVAELKTLKEAPEGLLGYLDLKFRFKSPDGLGITLDSNGIKGGGFIWKNQEEYAGIIDLDIRGFSVQALALLDTKDRSFLFAIFSQFRTPIQLGAGWKITRIGGVIGINRTVSHTNIISGIRSGILDSVLFPDNVIENAPKIISDFKKVYPANSGQHLIGPAVRIEYGTPTLIRGDIALILEFPSPFQLSLIGRVRAMLPDEKHPLLQINLVVLGSIDFTNEKLGVYGTL